MSEEIVLTREKFDELVTELEHLKTTRRTEIAEGLEYARSLGDLSENAEYQEARELQAATEERIHKLEDMIKYAKIASENKGGVVDFGSLVTVKKDGDDEEHEYMIVGSEEADMRTRKISHVSPLGAAMMGKKKSEEFTFSTPNGKQKFTVVSVK